MWDGVCVVAVVAWHGAGLIVVVSNADSVVIVYSGVGNIDDGERNLRKVPARSTSGRRPELWGSPPCPRT